MPCYVCDRLYTWHRHWLWDVKQKTDARVHCVAPWQTTEHSSFELCSWNWNVVSSLCVTDAVGVLDCWQWYACASSVVDFCRTLGVDSPVYAHIEVIILICPLMVPIQILTSNHTLNILRRKLILPTVTRSKSGYWLHPIWNAHVETFSASIPASVTADRRVSINTSQLRLKLAYTR